MDKKTFNNVRDYIVRCCVGDGHFDFNSRCYCNEITPSEFYEFIDELALKGFKDKYNQHNHPENNKD